MPNWAYNNNLFYSKNKDIIVICMISLIDGAICLKINSALTTGMDVQNG